jgi:hypothetical protein
VNCLKVIWYLPARTERKPWEIPVWIDGSPLWSERLLVNTSVTQQRRADPFGFYEELRLQYRIHLSVSAHP